MIHTEKAGWRVAIELVILVAGMSGVLLGGRMASADTIPPEDREKARKHFVKGQVRFESSEYNMAVEHFEIAFEITGAPDILFNIAMCYENADDHRQASIYYRRYLNAVPDTEDKEDIEAKIRLLEKQARREEDDADWEDADESDLRDEDDSTYWGEPKAEASRIKWYNVGMAVGPGFVIIMPRSSQDLNRHHYVQVAFSGDFFFNDWFAFSTALVLAGYVDGATPIQGREAKSHVGVGAGVAISKMLSKRWSLVTKLLVVPTAITRATSTRRATWLPAHLNVGGHIHLNQHWRITLELTGDVGPVFVVNPDFHSEWKPSLYLTAGARLGAAYAF